MKNCGIYKIRNKINGKFYLGSSEKIKRRWNEHKSLLRRNKHCNGILQKAWNKYGEENFELSVIEECMVNVLLEREQFYLDTMKPYRKIGYNISKISKGGDTFNTLTKKQQKIFKEKSIRVGKNNGMYGKEHTKNTINMMKEKSVGRFCLDWFKDRFGEEEGSKKYELRRTNLSSRNINYNHGNIFKGKKRRPLTDKEKKKISDQKTRIALLENDIKDAILSKTYTISEMAKKFETSTSTIKNKKRKYL